MTGSKPLEAPPPGWRLVRLGDACEIQLGKMLSPAAKTGLRPRPYLRNVNVQWGRFDLSEVAEMDFDLDEEEKFSLRHGDLLVCEGGEPGRAAVWQAEISPCFYQKALHRLRPVREAVDPMFVMYRLWLGATSQEFGGSHAKTTIAHLPAVRLTQLLIAAPELKVQKRIVAVLNEALVAAQRARDAAEARLDAARTLYASKVREVFTGPHARAWPCQRLGGVGQIASGVTLGRSTNGVSTRPVPYLRVANVKDGYLELSNVYEIEATDAEIDRLRLQLGDLLLTEGGDADKLGRGCVWRGEIPECIHQNHVFRVRFAPEEVEPDFVSAQTGSAYGKRYFLANAKQTTGIATINRTVLADFPLMLPGLAEQQQIVRTIAEYAQESGRIRQAVREEMVAIDALTGAWLRRAFSGEL